MVSRIVGFLALVVAGTSAHGADTGEVKGKDFAAKFANGWLVEWKNTATGETFKFGEPKIPAGDDYRYYRPGFWSIDPVAPEEEARRMAAVKTEIAAEGASGLTVRQSVAGVTNRLRALQWGIQVPYGDGLQVHWPRGLSPARVSGAGFQEGLLGPDYYFSGRAAAFIGTYKIRSNAYVILGKKGGLLVYMDNGDLKNFEALEFLPIDPSYKVGAADFADHVKDGIIISNRSMEPPTAGPGYTGGKWVVQQFTGGIPQAAQIYQDFCIKAYGLKPLAEKPTAWAQRLGLVFVNSPDVMRGPKTVEGERQPAYNYLSGKAWEEGIKADTEYLERLAKVIDPDRVMFYTTEWISSGMDTGDPEYSPDPYVAMMSRKARAMGYHVMLHFHSTLVQFPTAFTDKYILNAARHIKLDPEKDHIPGVSYDELRNFYVWIKGKEFGTSWNDRSGQKRKFDAFYMNPANGGWRWMYANKIVNCVLATGADAIHLDVPDWLLDRYNDQNGMNSMEGEVEFYKLLRRLLDEAGLEKVAIACELTPNEAYVRYVDLGQRSRNNSTRNRVEALARGSAVGAGENLITLQAGKSLDSILKERATAEKTPAPKLEREKALELFKATSKDLGVPSFDSAAFSRFVQGYPHLGANLFDGPQGYLAVWYWFINDVIPTGPYEELKQSMSAFYYGVFALARFRVQEEMALQVPGEWTAGDLADYDLKDGRRLRVYRADDTTLRLELDGGVVLAEMDVFSGWKNADLLFKKYGPPGVEIATPEELAKRPER